MKSPKVVLFSILGILFLFLSFALSWWFIIGAVVIMYINQKELVKKSTKTI